MRARAAGAAAALAAAAGERAHVDRRVKGRVGRRGGRRRHDFDSSARAQRRGVAVGIQGVDARRRAAGAERRRRVERGPRGGGGGGRDDDVAGERRARPAASSGAAGTRPHRRPGTATVPTVAKVAHEAADGGAAVAAVPRDRFEQERESPAALVQPIAMLVCRDDLERRALAGGRRRRAGAAHDAATRVGRRWQHLHRVRRASDRWPPRRKRLLYTPAARAACRRASCSSPSARASTGAAVPAPAPAAAPAGCTSSSLR